MAGFRAIVTIGLAAFCLLLAGPPMFRHPQTAYTGVHLRFTGALVQPNVADVEPQSPAYHAGLRSGDVVSCLSRRDYNILFFGDLTKWSPGYVAGTPITFCTKRGGVERAFRFIAQAMPPSAYIYGNDFIAALRLAEYVVFLLCGIALVMGRPGTLTWTFYVFCVASMPTLALDLNAVALSPSLYAFAEAFTAIVTSTSYGCLLLFTILVPDDRPPGGWRSIAYRIGWFAGAIPVALMTFARVQTDWNVAISVQNAASGLLMVATVVIVLARLVTMQRNERARFGWAAAAIIWGVVTNDLRASTVLPGYAGTVAAMLTVVMPVTLMYAILKRHVIDVRFVISRTVVYATITTLVVGLIGLVDWATSAYLHEVRVAMALEAIVTIALGFVLHRTYRWLEYAVDFFLFRRKHEAEAYLRRLARTLHFAEREDAIDKALVNDPYEKFDLTAAALFRAAGAGYVAVRCEGWNELDVPPFDRDHDVVRFLLAERTRLFISDLRTYVSAPFRERGATPAVAIPLFQGNRLTAFALYGIHRAGTQLDPDEIETLEHLCDAAAQAYTGIELARYQGTADMVMSLTQ